MNKRTLIASFVLILAMLACNLPGATPFPPPPPETTITETPTLILVSETPSPTLISLPTDTPFPTLTPTPTIPVAAPIDENVNCRLGPGTEWIVISALLLGQTAIIQGKNGDASWWYVATPTDPGKPCWVASSVTFTSGNLASLPVIPPPIASVTDVSIKLIPKEISLPLCIGPVQPMDFEGTISVNGPTKVKWHFETQQDGSMSSDTINFNFADSKKVEASSFTPDASAGTFWVRLVVTEPNSKSVEANYQVVCP